MESQPFGVIGQVPFSCDDFPALPRGHAGIDAPSFLTEKLPVLLICRFFSVGWSLLFTVAVPLWVVQIPLNHKLRIYVKIIGQKGTSFSLIIKMPHYLLILYNENFILYLYLQFVF